MPRNNFNADSEPVNETTADTDGDGVIEHADEYKSPSVVEAEAGQKVVLPMPQAEQEAIIAEREATPDVVAEPVVEDVEIDS